MADMGCFLFLASGKDPFQQQLEAGNHPVARALLVVCQKICCLLSVHPLWELCLGLSADINCGSSSLLVRDIAVCLSDFHGHLYFGNLLK